MIVKLLSLISYLLYLVSRFLFPSPIHAWEGDVEDVPTLKSLEGLFGNVLTVAISLMGIVTFIMIIVGGFNYLTSGGDPKKTEAAQAAITQGVIGLILAVAAYFILMAISSFTGVDLTKFTIGKPDL